MKPSTTALAALVVGALGCRGASNRILQPIFLDGRAVEVAGDSLIAMTRSGLGAIVVRSARSGELDTLGLDVLTSPVHVQSRPEGWMISDAVDGSWRIVVLDASGAFVESIDAGALGATPHQFAELPDGGVVLEAPNGVLLRVLDGVADTFALTDANANKTGLLIASSGGALHAVPDQHLTLYNGLGNPRWQAEWPWLETASVTDLAVDARGRSHVIAGIERNGYFVVYSLSTLTGEVNRWSEPGPAASFVVEKLGVIRPVDPAEWTAGE